MAITPSDAAVAARSFPRRWRALFASAAGDGDNPDLLARSGAESLADEAVGTLTSTAERIPALVPRTGAPTGGDALDRVDTAASALAAAVESVPADAWDGDNLAALDAGIQAVAELLRRAERQIDEARRAR